MKQKRTIHVNVEITFEYDTEHPNYFDEGLAQATAIDMAIRPTRSIEDGVKLLQVCNKGMDAFWLINND